MKFGKQLRFVAVRSWEQHYIAYKLFKQMIKQFQKQLKEAKELQKKDEEIQELKEGFKATFKEALAKNVKETTEFYQGLISNAILKCDELSQDLIAAIDNGNSSDDLAVNFHKRIFANVLTLYEIRTFHEINRSAAHNIIKKFCKHLDCQFALTDLRPLEKDEFDHQQSVDETLKRYDELFILLRRKILPGGDTRSRQDILLDLNKQVENALIWKQKTVVAKWDAYTFRLNEYAMGAAPIKIIPIIIAFVLMIPFEVYNWFGEGNYTAERCLGMIIFCATLWATTAVPLWLTSISIPFFSIVARLMPNTLTKNIAKTIEASTMNSTIYLILGGFTIAEAFKETEMDKRIASIILSKSTGSPRLFVLAVILLNAFLAMWINNVASSMIVVTLVAPTLALLPTDSKFAKSILLGIAAGGNFGGMTTPLASPQNAIAVTDVQNALESEGSSLDFGFAEFFATALPHGIICALIYWAILTLVWSPDIPAVPKFTVPKTDFGWRQIIVAIVTVISIVLWVVLAFGADTIFGDNGGVGFIPILLFYGTGILQPSKLAQMPWNIIFLVLGGNALGTAVDDSGLLSLASKLLKKLLSGTTLWVTLLIIDIFVVIINIFISHTVSSTIMIPLVLSFAAGSPHLRLFGLQAVLATTSSQILPVSSFPNLCCVSLQDKSGKEYLQTSDVIKSGSIATAICTVLLLSEQYGIAVAYGL